MTDQERFYAFVRGALVATFVILAAFFLVVVVFLTIQTRLATQQRDDLDYLVHLQCPSGVSVATCRGSAR